MHWALKLACASAHLALVVPPAIADAYPVKPIHLVVPAGAGTPPDVRARWLAERLSPTLGQKVVVENKPGAGGILGASLVARSAPDGYTLIAVTQGTMAFNPHLYTTPGYDALRDFAPVTRVSQGPMVLVVHPSLPARSVSDLVRLARGSPGQLTFGSAGVGTPLHMAAVLLHRQAGIDVTVVQYKSGNAAHWDVMADRLTYTFDGIGLLAPFVKAGTLKALAITGPHRVAAMPDVPTIAESGVPGYEYETWTGLCAPAGTPKEIVARLNAELVKILRSTDTREWFATQGMVPVGDSPEEFASVIQSDHAKWGRIIRDSGMKVD